MRDFYEKQLQNYTGESKVLIVWNSPKTGKISFKNLKRVAKEPDERMTEEEFQEMIDEAESTAQR